MPASFFYSSERLSYRSILLIRANKPMIMLIHQPLLQNLLRKTHLDSGASSRTIRADLVMLLMFVCLAKHPFEFSCLVLLFLYVNVYLQITMSQDITDSARLYLWSITVSIILNAYPSVALEVDCGTIRGQNHPLMAPQTSNHICYILIIVFWSHPLYNIGNVKLLITLPCRTL